MLSNTLARNISGALRLSALAGLLVVAGGCGNTPAQPTVVPSATPPPISAPTEAPTEAAPTDVPATPTSLVETPTVPAQTPTTSAVETSVPTPAAGKTPVPVGDLQWKQVGLAGTNLTDVAFLSEASNTLVLVAGPQGVWSGTYDYSTWEKHNVKIADEARNAEANIASPDVMYITSHTGCPSGLPTERQRSTDGGKTWEAMGGDALTLAVSNATTAYGAKCSGLNKTVDSGATWADLPGVTTFASDPISLAASPDGQTVYAAYVSEGGTGQIMMSTDGGATWTEVTPRNVPAAEGFVAPGHLTFVPALEGSPQFGGLYLTNDQGVWFLPLEGGDWKLMPKPQVPGDPENAPSYFTTLFVDTAYSEDYNKPGPVIYTARARSNESGPTPQGVWRSVDMGVTWESVGTGLGERLVNSVVLAPHDSPSGRVETLLAATADGVWALTMPPSR